MILGTHGTVNGNFAAHGVMPYGLMILLSDVQQQMTAVGFEPTPLRTGALSQRLRPLGQSVLAALLMCSAGSLRNGANLRGVVRR